MRYLSLVAHQPLRNCVYGVEDEQLRHTYEQLLCQPRYPCQRGSVPEAPDPRTRAVPDSEPLEEREGDIASGGGLARRGLR